MCHVALGTRGTRARCVLAPEVLPVVPVVPVPAVVVVTELDPRGVRLPRNVDAILRKPFQVTELLALMARFVRSPEGDAAYAS